MIKDLCDLCMSSDVDVNRVTYCGKTIGIQCGCEDENEDGCCNDLDCEYCSKFRKPRMFYRTVIQVEVLSEEPFSFDNLNSIHEAITDGDCSGLVTTVIDNENVDGPKMAKLLEEQGSDPSFFQLTNDGQDMEEEF